MGWTSRCRRPARPAPATAPLNGRASPATRLFLRHEPAPARSPATKCGRNADGPRCAVRPRVRAWRQWPLMSKPARPHARHPPQARDQEIGQHTFTRYRPWVRAEAVFARDRARTSILIGANDRAVSSRSTWPGARSVFGSRPLTSGCRRSAASRRLAKIDVATGSRTAGPASCGKPSTGARCPRTRRFLKVGVRGRSRPSASISFSAEIARRTGEPRYSHDRDVHGHVTTAQ